MEEEFEELKARLDDVENLLATNVLAGIRQHLSNSLMALKHNPNQKDIKVMAEKARLERDLNKVNKLYNDLFDKSLCFFKEVHDLEIETFQKKKS